MLFDVSNANARSWFGSCAAEVGLAIFGQRWDRLGGPTGDSGGEVKVGVGSSVDSADAPVSPRSSPPRLLEFRGRGISICFQGLSTIEIRE